MHEISHFNKKLLSLFDVLNVFLWKCFK